MPKTFPCKFVFSFISIYFILDSCVIIMSSPNKSCELDPLPTILLKSCLDTLLKPITDIINASLCSGLFQDYFKHAHVNPLLKKTSLPKEDLNSYRPVSSLSFMSLRHSALLSKISSVIQNHNLDHHLYADDTQIYISLATSCKSLPKSAQRLSPRNLPLDD